VSRLTNGYALMNLTSPTQIKSWCIENGFHPNRTLGQNFLIDRNALNAIVDAAGIRSGLKVLEIGPGLGVLTEAMLSRGATVTAVEKDRRLAERLANALGTPVGLEVVESDALKLDWDKFLGQGFDLCVSNLPYSVGTRILLDIALHPAAPAALTVLVQREVAERLAAAPGGAERSQAGVWLQLDNEVRILRQVGAACFWPRPEVGSSVVRIDRRGSALTAPQRGCFFDLTRYAFMHRRKQIGGSLRKAEGPLRREATEIDAILAKAGIDPVARAEQISNECWQKLASLYAGSRA
jgi:16S rRNA (adenine1518-N6/adenine1519-N6)-dimethyltransferase